MRRQFPDRAGVRNTTIDFNCLGPVAVLVLLLFEILSIFEHKKIANLFIGYVRLGGAKSGHVLCADKHPPIAKA